MAAQNQPQASEPIAVIGMACRFPGASNNPSRLWQLLRNPRDVGGTIPEDRFNISAFYHEEGTHHGTTNATESYFLKEDIKRFDASFFNISANEARSIDPQQRLLLETVYESLEAAGQRLGDLRGSDTAIYAGVMCGDFDNMLNRDLDAMPRYAATGTARSIISNRVSYFFDWQGPSVTVDTACSSSLVAVDLGVAALHQGRSRVAVAAGSSLILGPGFYVSESNLSMLSPTGKSRMWDSKADGYARGEGVAAVVLKKLSDAIADNDPIECVIRGTLVNSDGRSRGITMPSSEAQTNLIRRAYQQAGLDILNNPADRPQYFEAHGTGTPAGDPQESSAIYEAFFPESVQDKGILHVGSIKTLIGHTEGTAGLAGLIKAVLAMKHDVIPANMHLRYLNPKIAPLTKRLRVPTRATPWPAHEGVKRASVNSFGFGGTNAHVILESYEPLRTSLTRAPALPVLPFVFSATSERSLGYLLERYVEFLDHTSETDPLNLAWSLLCRRSEFAYRQVFRAGSVQELQQAIKEELHQRKAKAASTQVVRPTKGAKRILFIFTGQGAQWPQAALELLDQSPLVRGWLSELQDALDSLPNAYRPQFTLLDELRKPSTTSRVHEALISQPICTALQIILVRLMQTLNVAPTAVIGHSSGEIGAAYAAGMLTAAEAIKIAYLRGAVSKLAGNGDVSGAMMAVAMSLDEAKAICDRPNFQGRIKVAAVNSPSSLTLSGDAPAMKKLESELKQQNKFARLLKVDKAYHSHHMIPCSEAYRAALETCDISPNAPADTMWFSSVYDGRRIGGEHVGNLSATYWIENLLQPVLFSQAITSAADEFSFDIMVELGPHPALKGPVYQNLSSNQSSTPYAAPLMRGESAIQTVSQMIGNLWTHLGASSVEVERYVRLFDESATFKFIEDMPLYPFDHSNAYWPETRANSAFMHNDSMPHSLLGALTAENTETERRWRNFLRKEEIEWLADHRIQSQSVFPATAYVSMAIEAILSTTNKPVSLIEVDSIKIGKAIAIRDDPTGVEVLFVLSDLVTDTSHSTATFSCSADINGKLQECASGTVTLTFGEEHASTLPERSEPAGNFYNVDVPEFYEFLANLGYGYHGPFQGVLSLSRTLHASKGKLQHMRRSDSASKLLLHPALADSLIQTIFAAWGDTRDGQVYTLHVPQAIERIVVNPFFFTAAGKEVHDELAFETSLTNVSPNGVVACAQLYDSFGQGIVQIDGLTIVPLMKPGPFNDRDLFLKSGWGPLKPDATLVGFGATAAEVQALNSLDRIASQHVFDLQRLQTHSDKSNGQIIEKLLQVVGEPSTETYEEQKHPLGSSNVEVDLLRSASDVLRSRILGKDAPSTHKLRESYLENTMGITIARRQMSKLAEQIVWRYPRLRILEVAAGRCLTTRSILDAIGDSFYSYTVSGALDEHFNDLLSEQNDRSSRIRSQAIDLDRDVTGQGFAEHSFDFIIAQSPSAENLGQFRKLLKPGGFLLGAAHSNPPRPHDWLMLNAFDPSKLANVHPEWDVVLSECGFATIETCTSGNDSITRSVFVTRAMDEHMKMLKYPLQNNPHSPLERDLCIVGEPSDANLLKDTAKKLRPYFRSVNLAADFTSLDAGSFGRLTLIVLSETNAISLRTMGSAAFSSLQALVEKSYEFLWVETKPSLHSYDGGLVRGMMRCLELENLFCRYQYLTIHDEAATNANVLTEYALRLVQAELHNDYAMGSYVWSTEQEIRLKGGVEESERITHAIEPNKRLMTLRRPIHETIDHSKQIIEILKFEGSYELYARDRVSVNDSHGGAETIKVMFSTLDAIQVGEGLYLYVVFGHRPNSEGGIIALSETRQSEVTVRPEWVICSVPGTLDPQTIMKATVAAFIADTLCRSCQPGNYLLVQLSDDIIKSAISATVATRNVRVCFVSSTDDTGAKDTVFIHPQASKNKILQALPSDITVFADLEPEFSKLSARLSAVLPHRVRRESLETLCWASSHEHGLLTTDLVKISEVAEHSCDASSNMSIVDIHSVSGQKVRCRDIKIIQWPQNGAVQVRLRPATTVVKFSPDKTYLLVGLAGDLGRSMCKWMISRGAIHIVVASRNPQAIPQWWLDEVHTIGGNVVPMRMDATSKESILAVQRQISQALPPLGGIFNGALVITDATFSNLTYDRLLHGLRPKMDGSRLLEEVFGNEDLEFFIMFGSTVAVVGNPAQTPYAAANAYMSELVRKRRARGLVGSILDSSVIRGAGVIHNTGGNELEDRFLYFGGALPLSERDIHQAFAECVIAGRPDSHLNNNQVIAGISSRNPTDPNWQNIVWYQNPRMWNLLDYHLSDSTSSSEETVPMLEQLLRVTSVEEGVEVVADQFIARLRARLRLPSDEEVSPATSPLEYGVDSLIATDLRMWFLRELGADVPLLKLLSGDSICEIVTDVVSGFPAEVMPGVEREISAQVPSNGSDAGVGISDQSDASSSDAIESETTKSDRESGITTPDPEQTFSKQPDLASLPIPNRSAYTRIERLSFAQSRFWFLSQYDKKKSAHNISTLLSLNIPMDAGKLQQAVRMITDRHESFRTCYLAGIDGLPEPIQAVMPTSTIPFEVVNGRSEDDIQAKYLEIQEEEYDLEKGRVGRTVLVNLPTGKQALMFGFHHICMDGGSFRVCMAELEQAYTGMSLPPPKEQYPTFARTQRLAWESGEMNSELNYWKQQFQSIPEAIPVLPMSKLQARVPGHSEQTRFHRIIPATTMRKILDGCRKAGSTAFNFFVAALRVYLSRLSGADDFCIGITDANRLSEASQTMIGFLLNLLPLRFQTSTENQSFMDVFKHAQKVVLEALQHSRLPFDLILQETGVPRSSEHTPLFQVLLDYQYMQSGGAAQMNFWKMDDYHASDQGYDMSMLIMQWPNGDARVQFQLEDSLYPGSRADLVADSFMTLVESLAEDFGQICGQARIFETAPLENALHMGKGTIQKTVWPTTISKRIETIARADGGKLAVKEVGGNSTTYGELLQRADAVACQLKQLGVTAKTPVCLFQYPTTDWVSCALGIWKLDATYVPLDLRNPVSRLAKIVRDCGPTVILCHDDTELRAQKLDYPQAKLLNTSKLASVEESFDESQADSVAALLYTSGTTGTPKGVRVLHSNLANWAETYTAAWGLGEETVLQQCALGFDLCIGQMMVGLCNGGQLIVAPHSHRGDPMLIAETIRTENVTYTLGTPSEYAQLTRYGATWLQQATAWKMAVSCGEPWKVGLVDLFKSLGLSNLHVYNAYGPAETTVISNQQEVHYQTTEETELPVGKPFPNYAMTIVGPDLKPVPQGVRGEILISGAGVSDGYRNRDQLNDEKFILNPALDGDFAALGWATSYRSGDQGYLLKDGSLVVTGRIDGDTQVKVRGNRMDLMEIEEAIFRASNEKISGVVVDLRGDQNEFLAAHVVLTESDNKEQALTGIRNNIALPQYMVPSLIVPVSELPLTVSGKIDRRAVAAWPLPQAQRTSASGLSDDQESLLKIWLEVVGETFSDETIDVDTSFFEIGGSSVTLVELQRRVYEEFGVRLTLRKMLEANTLADMSERICDAAAVKIDWASETSIEDIAVTDCTSLPPRASGLTIVISGATGCIGTELTQKLLAEPRVNAVHAVALRSENGLEKLNASSEKLVIHRGDLSIPYLGLDAKEFQHLGKSASLIISCGGKNSNETYSELRGANVLGTKALIQLAAIRATPIHFVSGGDRALSSLEGEEPPSNGNDGYVASKWASEQLLHKANAKLGMPVTIHRFSPSDTMSLPDAKLQAQLRAMVDAMRSAPYEPNRQGTIALVSIEDMAEQMLEKIVENKGDAGSSEQSGVKMILHQSTVGMPVQNFKDDVEAALKSPQYQDYGLITMETWLLRAKNQHDLKWVMTE